MNVMWHMSMRIIDPTIDQFLEWLQRMDNDGFDHIHYENTIGYLLVIGPNMQRFVLKFSSFIQGLEKNGGTLTDPRFKDVEVFLEIGGQTPDSELIYETVPKEQVIRFATSLIVNQSVPAGLPWD